MLVRTRSSTPEKAARQVLDAWWDGLLPVNPRTIARRQGIRMENDPHLDVSGVVSLEEDTPVIRVNTSESEVRQRFTVAHELGHVVLQHLTPEKRVFRDPKQNYTLGNFDPRERDANRFAAMLLMPPEAVQASLARMKTPDIEKLAQVFGVSNAAMKIRLKTMGILPEWI